MSSFVKPDGEPTVTATLAAEDEVYEVSPRYGSVHLKGLSMEAQGVLSKFDRNGDGEVDESELEGVVDVLVKEQFKGRMFLCGIQMIVLALVVLLASIFGLAWAVVSINKSTALRNRVLVRKNSDDPVQIANSDFTMAPSGAITARGNSRAVLGTSTLYVNRQLNANMTTSDLTGLVRVKVSGTNGANVGFRVTGFSLRSSNPPQLHISTPAGILVLLGDRLTSYNAAQDLVDTDELAGQSVTGIFAG
ncbi:hypothetical protein Vretimale_4703 [Volvox reticuliferus]|uniref:EF-hand domain-containing protein n=1 Tax=Volvox reticuliferus TaxID=1737510 RepID=A0A8J4C7C4_9CHLO|nr:hypothetical protein Vretifemale_3305 [Volvox reticuliferus]GIL99564.1 hypothetical protein Vretimale_4703 [Volvox reticuliferus]